MVKLDKDLRVHFGYMIQHLAKNGMLPLTVVRAGKAARSSCPCRSSIRRWSGICTATIRPTSSTDPLVFSTATWQLVCGLESNAGTLRALGFVKSPLITRALDPPGRGAAKSSSWCPRRSFHTSW